MHRMETRLAKVMEQQTEKEIKEKGLLKGKDIHKFVSDETISYTCIVLYFTWNIFSLLYFSIISF